MDKSVVSQQHSISKTIDTKEAQLQARLAKIKENEDKMSHIQMSKSQVSDPFFKEAKVVSCSQVLVKNGQAVAIAFGGSSKSKDAGTGRTSFRDSLSQ